MSKRMALQAVERKKTRAALAKRAEERQRIRNREMMLRAVGDAYLLQMGAQAWEGVYMHADDHRPQSLNG